MGKKKKKKAKLKELQEFIKDDCETAADKNRKLSTHVLGTWLELEIVKIKRIAIGSDFGWQLTYRE
jgi:hypothetical protein